MDNSQIEELSTMLTTEIGAHAFIDMINNNQSVESVIDKFN